MDALSTLNRMKILFLIRSLDIGGAERQLVTLAKGLHAKGHEVHVAVFYANGPLECDLAAVGVQIHFLEKQGRWDVLPFVQRLLRLVRNLAPDILHGYMDEPNLLVLVIKLFSPRVRVVWGVRAASLDFSQYGWVEKVSSYLNARLAQFADAVIVNSQAGQRHHVEKGYPPERMVVIPNGIDTERFRPDRLSGRKLRMEWGIVEAHKLVGLVGRLDPMKDHPIFFKAAALLASREGDIEFVCVGGGDPQYQSRLEQLVASLGLEGRVRFVGARDDMPAVYNALDCHVSCSYGEGLSNVVAEAMACGVPCVVTDVGDSAWMVGAHGEVVPPKEPQALADAVERVLRGGRPASSQMRSRIIEHLSIGSLVARTEDLFGQVLGRSNQPWSSAVTAGGVMKN